MIKILFRRHFDTYSTYTENAVSFMHQSIESPEGGGGNGRAMSGLSCLVHQNAAPQGGDITN